MIEPTTSTTQSDNTRLTIAKFLAVKRLIDSEYRILWYRTSEYVPDGPILRIPNDGATSLGFDVILHPNQLSALIEQNNSSYMLRELDEAEHNRRFPKNVLRKPEILKME